MRINFNHINRIGMIVVFCLLFLQYTSAQNPSATSVDTTLRFRQNYDKQR